MTNTKQLLSAVLVPAAVILMSALDGSAAVALTSYNTTPLTGTEGSVAPQSSATGVTGVNLTRGAGLTATGGAGSINSSGWTGEAGDNYSFGFNVNPGYAVAFNRLSLGSQSSGTGPGSVGVYAAVDGGAESLVYTLNQAAAGAAVKLNSDVVFNTPLLVSQSLRLFLRQIGTTAVNGGATSATGTFQVIDWTHPSAVTLDVLLWGTLSIVPEPGTWGMIGGLGLMTIVFLRSSRRGQGFVTA